MTYTEEQMNKDDKIPDCSIKRIVKGDGNEIIIKILMKQGYSWVDANIGVIIDLHKKEVMDQDGIIVGHWEEKFNRNIR